MSIYQKIANACKIAVYVDDFKRLNYPEGVILNFAPDADELFYKDKEEKYFYLLGLEYLPIRGEFLNAKIAKKEQIFIMLGGSDTANLSLELIHSLRDVSIKKFIVTNDSSNLNSLKKYKDVKILYKPSDLVLVEAMASSFMAVSTASMSAYELAYLKVPTIIIAVAKNQEIGVAQFIKYNIATDFVSIGNKNWQDEVKIKTECILTQNYHDISHLIDGKGSDNIVSEILELIK